MSSRAAQTTKKSNLELMGLDKVEEMLQTTEGSAARRMTSCWAPGMDVSPPPGRVAACDAAMSLIAAALYTRIAIDVDCVDPMKSNLVQGILLNGISEGVFCSTLRL